MEMTPVQLDARPRERGISLVETLAALVILGMVTVSVLLMFTYSMELNVTGMDYATLTNRSRDKAEQLLASGWYDDALAPGGVSMHPDLDASTNPHTEVQSDSHLRLVWNITDRVINQAIPNYPGGPAVAGTANIKAIIVTAVSTSASGIGRRDVNIGVLKIKGEG